MIPLAHWLSGEWPALPQPGALPFSLDDRNGLDFENQAGDLDSLLTNAREQARNEFHQEAAALVAAARQEERISHESREAMIVAEWSARCAEVTGTALASHLQKLQGSIGKALADVLHPLLPGALHQRAIAELLELLNREFATAGSEFLEVRAPPETHAKLRVMLDRLGIQVVLTDSEKVEVVSSHGISRFEQLAQAWAGLVLPGQS